MSIGPSSGCRPCAITGQIVLALLLAGCDRQPRIGDGMAAVRSLPTALAAAGDIHRDEIAAGETIAYRMDLQSGEAILVEVDQREVDIAVEIVAPDGARLLSFDAPTGRSAPERVCAVTAIGGPHSLRLMPYSGSGGYTVRLVRRARATARDRACFAATRIFQGAGELAIENRIEAYERAAALWQTAGEHFLGALALRESASAWRSLGPESGAVDRFERALKLARRAGNSYLEVSILNRFGLALIDAGEFAAAQERLNEAESRARETGDEWGRASALTNLGLLDDLRGDPYRAIDRYTEALSAWREIGDSAEIAQTLLNMATAFGVLDRHDRALDLLTEALALSRQARDVDRQTSVLSAIGWIHYLRGRPEEGIPALDAVIVIRRRQRDLNGLAASLDRRGTLLRSAGRFQEAERSYKDSLTLSLDTGSSYDAASTLANLGCLFAETGAFDEARRRLQDALPRLETFDDPRAVSHVEYCLALTNSAEGSIDAALGHVGRALEIVSQIRDLHRRHGHHYRPIWLWQDYAELEIDLLLQRYRLSPDSPTLRRLFESADLSRARTLFEKVVETRAGVRGDAAWSVLQRERDLQGELNRLAQERDTAETTERTGLEAELRHLGSELERVRASIRAANPRYQAALPHPVTVEEARRLLAPRTALLSYVLGDEASHLLVLDASRLTLYELPPRQELETYARTFHKALRSSRASPDQWRLIAASLGERLLPENALPPEVDRLIIVAEGLLHYVPFAALESPRNSARLVIDDFLVSYAPSVSVLKTLQDRGRWRRPFSVGVFADPVYTAQDPRLTTRSGASAGGENAELLRSPSTAGWSRLVSSADEAHWIAEMAAPQDIAIIRMGFEATKDIVLQTDLAKFKILHFAMHARIDETFPELSGLVFSRFDGEGRSVDPELRLHEIHGLTIDADLTILSGCATALGKHVRGDGLQALSNGFFYAGSDRLVVTVWEVYDQSTARLMAEFYRKLLREELPPTIALRDAQLWLRSQPQWREPVYWAPFILQGLD